MNFSQCQHLMAGKLSQPEVDFLFLACAPTLILQVCRNPEAFAFFSFPQPVLSLVSSLAGSGGSYQVGISQRMVKQEPEQCQG